MAESQILKSCKNRLDWWERLGQVIFWDRLNSGNMQINGRWVQMCKSGSPDLVAYVNKDNYIWVCFFECKADEKSIVQESQKDFQFKWKSIRNVIYEIVWHPNMIDKRIELITNYYQKKLDSLPVDL